MNFFDDNYCNYGPDSFSPTMAVFAEPEELIGLVTCRETVNQNDLYKAMAEMLFFPAAARSELFIVAQDVKVSIKENSGLSVEDGLVVSFVSPDFCVIVTVPYSYNSDNTVQWHIDQAFVTTIASEYDSDSPIGDMAELFYVYSHVDNNGPFSYTDILRYFNHVGFKYEIMNEKYLTRSNSALSVTWAVST
jgi:hypothetical protein